MNIVVNNNEHHNNRTKTDNLILALFAYYLMSVPIALVISGLLYPYLMNSSYVLAFIMSIIFLFLTFKLQKLDNRARLILLTITILLLVGSLFFPFFIPSQNNGILSRFSITYHSFSIADYIFYALGVDGSFLIFGLFLIYVLHFDKRTVNLFNKV